MILEGKEAVKDFIEKEGIKYFKPEEFMCNCGCGSVKIDSDLIVKLENLRRSLGRPVFITSAYRCPSWNKKVSKVENSAHTRGYAVDVRVHNSRDRFEIISFLLNDGIGRIGVAKSFVHFDIDPDKPQQVIWTY